jgi:DNA-binding CsgD family transcriptional regulator
MAAGDDLVTVGTTALREGRWSEARAAFEQAVAVEESGAARFGLATAAWWLGDNQSSVDECTRAYAMFRKIGDVAGAVECAVWLGITYKANFSNFAAANGWIERAQRMLEGEPRGPLHGWVELTRAYRMPDLIGAQELTQDALDIARRTATVDLELTAISQLGLIRVARGRLTEGFALIDESMAAALAGEPSNLATVVYTCCDMLNACELAGDAERAAQWCDVAGTFVDKYGCPFLYAECRIVYGSVLTASGRWDAAERELQVARDITHRSCPGLHDRATTRLALLWIRQGRLEDAAATLTGISSALDAGAEHALAAASLMLARGDARGASAYLARHWALLADHRSHLAHALDLLVDAQLAAGELDAAGETADRLAAIVGRLDSRRLRALAPSAQGRVFLSRGEPGKAITELGAAARIWATAGLPFEVARTELELARALAWGDPPHDREAAITVARRALAGFETLGAERDADRAAAFLRSLGVVARTGAKGVGTLTDREGEVLELVGAGLTNPEIAERLHISRKTAAHHVSSILTKLDLRNRSEAAALAATLEAGPAPTRQ